MANKVLYDLSLLEDIKRWRSIDDLVMGGKSRSRLTLSDCGGILFSGTLCCDAGSGFASIRSETNLFDLSRYSGLAIKIKGDGRRYKLSLRCATDFDGIAYKVAFQTRVGIEQTIRVKWDVFVANYHGRILAAAPILDPAEIRSVGFIVADKQSGSFQLEILNITAFTRIEDTN